MAHVAAHGITDLSLRALATELGTSHRMLIHHFGSKEGLWTAIVQEVERSQIAAVASLELDPSATIESVLWERWLALSDASLWPSERLFFEVYARALNGAPGTAGFLDEVVESWLGPGAEAGAALGVPPDQARPLARLAVAVTRGLLLDLLATGQRDEVDAAMRAWIDSIGYWSRRGASSRS